MLIRSHRCLCVVSTCTRQVVEDDEKLTGTSLSLTILKAGGNQNKLWNPLSQNKGKIRPRKWDNLYFRGSPKHSMTLIRVERY